jgi:FAD/FMN-containing dehydrogenase
MSKRCTPHLAGGGNGWGEPLYGAAADNVESFRVVLPQEQGRGPEGGATVVEVTQESDPDLFAGLKGAGESGSQGLGQGVWE